MWPFCLVFIEVWHLWLSWRDALPWSWWNYQGCWQAAGLWYFLFLYHSFTVSQRRWGGGWAGDSYVVCLHLTTPNQRRREEAMWDVWLSIFLFFHFSYWLEIPREPPRPNDSRKTFFLRRHESYSILYHCGPPPPMASIIPSDRMRGYFYLVNPSPWLWGTAASWEHCGWGSGSEKYEEW